MFFTGVASILVGTGFGIDLAVRPQPERTWNEPVLTGGLIVGGLVLVGLAVYFLAAEAVGGLARFN